jgi:hypothetical protein
MVVACLALAVALGGTGYAAITLPRNSVGSKQLRATAVTGAKVEDGSLAAKDLGGPLPRGPRGCRDRPASRAGTASRLGYASRDPSNLGAAVPIGLNAARGDLVILSTPAGTAAYGGSSGLVTAAGPSRLVADGQVVIVDDAGAPGFLSCRLLLVGTAAREVGRLNLGRVAAGDTVDPPLAGLRPAAEPPQP